METTRQSKRVVPVRRPPVRAASRDLPLKPRFMREVVVAPSKNGIVADGGGSLVVLQGNATKALIPELIRLMDGTRTIDELYSALETVPKQHVRAAISVLTNSGLVTDSDDAASGHSGVNRDTLSFLERFSGTANLGRNGMDAYSRLRSANIALVAPGSSGEVTRGWAKLLTTTGAANVTLLPASESVQLLQTDLEQLPAGSLVVSLSLAPEDRRFGLLLDAECERRQLSWLRIGLDESGSFFDVGPLFGLQGAACYSCFLAAHSYLDVSQLRAPTSLTRLETEFWLSFAATEVVFLASRLAYGPAGSRFRRYSVDADRSRSLNFFRRPGCAHCRPAADLVSEAVAPQSVPTALVFEDYVGEPLTSKGAGEEQLGPAALRALSRQTKEFPHSEHIQLTRTLPNLEYSVLDLLRGRSPQAERLLNAEELGQLLMLSVGIRRFGRNGTIKRWGATSGNLGSVEAFVAVHHAEGLESGIYFYQARDHSLALIENDRAALVEFIRSATGIVDEAPEAIVILTGAYHRVSRKYGPFGYRLTNLDGGVAASQISLIASALGRALHRLTAWDDHVIEQRLNLKPFHEQVTNVLALYSARDHVKSSPGLFSCASLARNFASFCGESVTEITERLYRASRCRSGSVTEGISNTRSRLRSYTNGPQAAALSEMIEGGRTLAEILSHRSSVRNYTNDPVSLTQLAGMLSAASAGDCGEGRSESEAVPLEFLILAIRVEGIMPGAYVYDRSAKALRQWRVAYSPERQRELFVQEEFAHSPLTIWVFSSLAACCEKRGDFGHRELLLRAGAAVHRCWMAALSLGMQGCPIAGIVPGAARELLGLDGYFETSLLAFTAGHTSFEQLRQPGTTVGNVP